MASIIRIRDNDGNIIEIPALRGPQGNAGKITEVTATVDDSTGTPAVAVTLGGTEEERTIDLAFTGLKGEGGISEVSADVVSAGTFAGTVKANAEATADLSVAQVRNVMVGTEEPTDEIIASLNVGDFYFVKEA